MKTLIAALFILTALGGAFAQTPPSRCATPEARQFDFWVGTWELTWKNADGTSGTRTTRTSDRC